MYGPVDGIPFVDWSLAGVFAGRIDENCVARMERMSPSGCASLTSLERVLSFVTMPGMWPFFVVENWSPPWIAEKKPTPGESTLYRRSIEARKSLALTGVPSEYFRLSRSWNLRSFPSAETVGMLFARYGTSV